jgi:predicted Zn-ribbon and HTH transcriptional regulator
MTDCTHEGSGFTKPKYEVADIFRDNIDRIGKVNKDKWDVINSIINCRTQKLGGHVLKCDSCGHEEISYNSCRNRHCPKCQSLKRLKWIDDRISELLPVQYFHVVFTIPDFFNPIVLQNKRIFHNILFRAVKETLLEAAENKKNLGAEIGFITILHTWGQNLLSHPHIHCVVTGGGLSDDKKWVSCKKDFFISVKILSRLFRGKFLCYLKEAYKKSELIFEGKIRRFKNTDEFNLIIDKGYSLEWVVYSKKPFAGPEQVIRYLGKYTHRVAIGNSRIVNVSDSEVQFKWKDYKDGGNQKIMTVSIEEFIRRFLLHVFPKRFVRIRFYGFLSNVKKNENLKITRELFNNQINYELDNNSKKEAAHELFLRMTGIDITRCPYCKNGTLSIVIDDFNAYLDSS